MILDVENSEDPTRKQLELINAVTKAAVYKINREKPVAFLYAHDELSERKIKEMAPFTFASK